MRSYEIEQDVIQDHSEVYGLSPNMQTSYLEVCSIIELIWTNFRPKTSGRLLELKSNKQTSS